MAVGIALFFGTILAMEAVAYGAHRWVMHGPGWFLHESHHRHREGLFELNDLYALIFAIPSILLLLGGVHLGWGSWAVWVAPGSPLMERSTSASTTSSFISVSHTAMSRALRT